MEASSQDMLPQKPLQWEGKVASHTVALKVTYITPTHSALVSVSHMATCNLKRTEKCNPTMFPRVGVIYWMELETGYNGIPEHLFGTHPDLLSQQFPSSPFFPLPYF